MAVRQTGLPSSKNFGAHCGSGEVVAEVRPEFSRRRTEDAEIELSTGTRVPMTIEVHPDSAKLDGSNASVTLATLGKAALVLGRKLRVELVPA